MLSFLCSSSFLIEFGNIFLCVSPTPWVFALNLFLLFLSSRELHHLFQVLLIFCSLLWFFFNFILFLHFPITHFITSASLFPTICDFFILIVSPSHLVPGWHLFTSHCSPFNHYSSGMYNNSWEKLLAFTSQLQPHFFPSHTSPNDNTSQNPPDITGYSLQKELSAPQAALLSSRWAAGWCARPALQGRETFLKGQIQPLGRAP